MRRKSNYIIYYVIIGLLLAAIAATVLHKPGSKLEWGSVQKLALPEAYYLTRTINDTFYVVRDIEDENGHFVSMATDLDEENYSLNIDQEPFNIIETFIPNSRYDALIGGSEAVTAQFTATLVIIPQKDDVNSTPLSRAQAIFVLKEAMDAEGQDACKMVQEECYQNETLLYNATQFFDSTEELYEYLKKYRFIKSQT